MWACLGHDSARALTNNNGGYAIGNGVIETAAKSIPTAPVTQVVSEIPTTLQAMLPAGMNAQGLALALILGGLLLAIGRMPVMRTAPRRNWRLLIKRDRMAIVPFGQGGPLLIPSS
jgi:hypothetical protein